MKTAEEYEADIAGLKMALASAQSRCEFLEGRRREGVKEMLDEINALTKAVHDFFGYKEDWVCIPLSDETDWFWFIIGGDEDGEVVGSSEPLTVESVTAGDNIFGGSVYTQRFLPKWVYRAGGYTLVCVDTQTDGNKFLSVLDDSKMCSDPAVIAAYEEEWG